MKGSILKLLLATTCACATGGFQTPTANQPGLLQAVRNKKVLTVTKAPLVGPANNALNTHHRMASVNAEQEWTPKRLHNTNWFRSAAILLAVSLMGVTAQSSPITQLSTQTGAALHLFAFSTWFGTMVYTTFIFGITAFKNLPRQTFGKLQAKLFPKYFSLGSICLVLQILTLRSLSLDIMIDKAVQYSLGSTLIATLYNQFSLEPYTTQIMLERYELENSEGGTDTERYKALRKQFGKMHGLSSLTNLIALCGTIAYGLILSAKLVA